VRVVIDTNVWISGLLWRGLPWRLLRLAEEGRLDLCMTPAMREELADVLGNSRLKPRLGQLSLTSPELVDYAVGLVDMYADTGVREPPIVAADPDADVFLLCAISAGARYVVSGDRHLLSLGAHGDVLIVSVRDFFMREFPGQLTS
jgi:putative PIN family toxin of toxin-antitoxin system